MYTYSVLRFFSLFLLFASPSLRRFFFLPLSSVPFSSAHPSFRSFFFRFFCFSSSPVTMVFVRFFFSFFSLLFITGSWGTALPSFSVARVEILVVVEGLKVILCIYGDADFNCADGCGRND